MNKKDKLLITFTDWHYTCGDGCCDMYGTEISLNGDKCDNQYSGDSPEQSLIYILEKLGYEVEINFKSDE